MFEIKIKTQIMYKTKTLNATFGGTSSGYKTVTKSTFTGKNSVFPALIYSLNPLNNICTLYGTN